jgi:dipeptidase
MKYALSSHFQGTPYDPYAKYGDPTLRGAYRPIGVNRTSFLSLLQIRPSVKKEIAAIEWIAFGSNVFNALVPLYANVQKIPDYFSNTTLEAFTGPTGCLAPWQMPISSPRRWPSSVTKTPSLLEGTSF